jgi:hypothetical protein
MSSVPILEKARIEGWTDEEIVQRVLKGELAFSDFLCAVIINASIARYAVSSAMTPRVRT